MICLISSRLGLFFIFKTEVKKLSSENQHELFSLRCCISDLGHIAGSCGLRKGKLWVIRPAAGKLGQDLGRTGPCPGHWEARQAQHDKHRSAWFHFIDNRAHLPLHRLPWPNSTLSSPSEQTRVTSGKWRPWKQRIYTFCWMHFCIVVNVSYWIFIH